MPEKPFLIKNNQDLLVYQYFPAYPVVVIQKYNRIYTRGFCTDVDLFFDCSLDFNIIQLEHRNPEFIVNHDVKYSFCGASHRGGKMSVIGNRIDLEYAG